MTYGYAPAELEKAYVTTIQQVPVEGITLVVEDEELSLVIMEPEQIIVVVDDD